MDNLISPRTQQRLRLNARRFRFSIATHMAEEGASLFHIAEALDHSDTQNVKVYVETASSIADPVARATDSALMPLVHRFQGRIVDSDDAASLSHLKVPAVAPDLGIPHLDVGGIALVVGYYEGRKLIYAARVRAGLVPASRRELYEKLRPLTVQTCPFVNLPEATPGRWGQGLTAAKMKECIWVKPKLVANFEFLEWTDSNHVRHIKFVGLRSDKDPLSVARE